MRRGVALLAAVILAGSSAPVRAGTPFDASVAPALYTQMLRLYVERVPVEGTDAFETRFDYAGFAAREDAHELRRGLRITFLSVEPGALGEDARLAWAINAYNFLVIDRILEEPPGTVGSVGELDGGDFAVFDTERYTVDGAEYGLDSFESHFLFGDPDREAGRVDEDLDPRLHFAVVCGARGCPPLLPGPYTAADLDAQLDRAVRNALANPRHLRVEDGRVRVSPLFDWYAADFMHVAGGIRGFLRRYGPADLPSGDFEIVADLEWDWSLNRP